MIKKILKMFSVLGLSFLTVALFLIGQFPLIEGKYFLDKYIDTRFAKDYKPEKFEQVKVGMEIDDVFNLVGQPLYTYNFGSNTKYQYTGDGKLGNDGDFAWYLSTVEVNFENIVVNIEKNWLYN